MAVTSLRTIREDKVVKHFNEIADIVDATVEETFDPDFKGKRVLSFIFSENVFYKSIYNYNPRNSGYKGYMFKDSDKDLFYIVVKETTLFNLLPVYFHELGHVANYGLKFSVQDKNLNAILSETLATAYSLWAIETVKQKFNFSYKSSRERLTRAARKYRFYNFSDIDSAVPIELLCCTVNTFNEAKAAYFWLKESLKENEPQLYNLLLNVRGVVKSWYEKQVC